MRLEILVRVQDACSQKTKQLFLLFSRDRRRTQLRIGIVLIIENHHGQERAAVFLVGRELLPRAGAQQEASPEAMRPIIAARNIRISFFKLPENRYIKFSFSQRVGNGVEVAENESQNLLD